MLSCRREWRGRYGANSPATALLRVSSLALACNANLVACQCCVNGLTEYG